MFWSILQLKTLLKNYFVSKSHRFSPTKFASVVFSSEPLLLEELKLMAMGLLSGIRALAWAIVLLMESRKIIGVLGGCSPSNHGEHGVFSIRITD